MHSSTTPAAIPLLPTTHHHSIPSLTFSSLPLLPFHQEMESELRLMLPRRPTTLNSGRSRNSGRMAPLLPSLPNGREAKRLRSIYRRSSILDQVQSTPTTTIAAPWVRHRIVAFDYSCTVGILATCLLNDGVRPAFKYKALRTASLWYYYQLTRETDMVSSRPRRLLTFRKQRCPGGGMEEGRGREHSEICAPD